MEINLANGASTKLSAKYVDASNSVTAAPLGAGQITWTADRSMLALDVDIGPDVTITATGAVGAVTQISVTDGSFTSQVATITITAGPAVGLEIQQS